MILTEDAYQMLKKMPVTGVISYPYLRKQCVTLCDEQFKKTLLYLKNEQIVFHHFTGDRDVIRDDSTFSISLEAIGLMQQYRHDRASRRVGIATLIISIVTLLITVAPLFKYLMQSIIFSN